MFDFIGDIHGEFDRLVELLIKLGYQKKGGTYRHPTRKAYFLGDLVDRGPKIKETLDLVYRMEQEGQAKCIMGNHEFNLICYFTESNKNPGTYLRPRTLVHERQCQETLRQLSSSELKHYLAWMKTLPLFEETKKYRAVHACWHPKYIKCLDSILNNRRIDDTSIQLLCDKSTPYELAMEISLKGLESKVEQPYSDNDGHLRTEVRLCWWNTKQKLVKKVNSLDEDSLIVKEEKNYKYSDKIPVFFGHYWLGNNPHTKPYITGDYAQCLDFSVAKDGYLACYRLDDSPKLQEKNLIYV